ncbi:MAG: thiamine phosphate synthase [bacterium]|nr:thiamine phosphate synthase [bacterium]
MKHIGKLHVLTDTVLQNRFSHIDLTRMALEGGADTIQYRQKVGKTRERIETALAMQALCSEAGAILIVNDRVDVAIAANVDGVHLGQEDFPIEKARDLLGPDKVIGATAKTVVQIQQAVSEGADYVGFGPIYATGSKADAGDAKGLDGLSAMVQAVSVPVVAIGGIGLETAQDVMAAGAFGIALISAVCCEDDPVAATRAIAGSIGMCDQIVGSGEQV